MTRKPVKSSNIAAIGYNPDSQELEIEFKGGGIYRYAEVPAEAHREFVTSESPGRHFAAHIKKQFQCQRVVILTALVAGQPCHEDVR